LLLAGICLGGVFFTSRWAQHMRLRFDRETREARSALRRSEANFRHFFENNPAPMLLYDRENGEFADVNQAAVERYGYTRGEFLERTIFDIRPAEDVPKVKAVMRDPEYRRQDFRHAGEWRHITRSGELMYVDVRVSALTIDNRALNLVLVYDVSPRKQAQAAVERRARELQSLAASSLEIAGARTVDGILQACAERARELSGARIAIARCLPDHLRFSLAQDYAAWREPGKLPDTDLIWQVLINKRFPQRVSAEEVKAHRLYPQFVSRHGRLEIGAVLAVPLTRSDSELVGALIVANKGGSDFLGGHRERAAAGDAGAAHAGAGASGGGAHRRAGRLRLFRGPRPARPAARHARFRRRGAGGLCRRVGRSRQGFPDAHHQERQEHGCPDPGPAGLQPHRAGQGGTGDLELERSGARFARRPAA
jgi:PAS domain S-box-containing protein